MVFKFSNSLEKTFTANEPTNIDVSRNYSKFSKVGFDEEKKVFWATIDKLCFKTLYNTIEEVLVAHGFVANFENVVSCIDNASFGIRAKVEQTDNQVKQFAYVICFGLPQKNKVGSLLKSFYEEISIYEDAILKGKSNQKNKDSKTSESQQDNNTSKKLLSEIIQLKAYIEKLQKRINNATAGANEETLGDSLPEGMRIGEVSNLLLSERQVSIRVDNKVFHYPLSKSNHVPQPKEKCIIFSEGGLIKRVFFYEAKEVMTHTTAKVLHTKDGIIKLRDDKRQTYILSAINDEEKSTFSHLVRKSNVLLGIYQNQVIKIATMDNIDDEKFSNHVQEKIAKHQIDHVLLEEYVVDEEYQKSLEAS